MLTAHKTKVNDDQAYKSPNSAPFFTFIAEGRPSDLDKTFVVVDVVTYIHTELIQRFQKHGLGSMIKEKKHAPPLSICSDEVPLCKHIFLLS